MNKRGELEIAINKRWIERGVFLLVIIALGVLLIVRSPEQLTARLQANVTQLTEERNQNVAQILDLQKQLEDANKEVATLEKAAEKPAAETKPAATTPALSGTVTIDWSVDGELLTPAEYNAKSIENLEADLAELEDEYDSASQSRQDALDEQINDLKREIADLKKGDSKFKLYNVTLSIENGKDTNGAFDYIMCWPFVDCVNVRAMGTVNVASGKSVDYVIPLTIPSLVTIDKTSQQLRISVKQDGKEIFKDDYIIKAT